MQAEYVAVPLVSEQERIAAILDEQMAAAERVRNAARDQFTALSDLALAAAGGALKEPLRRRQNFERI